MHCVCVWARIISEYEHALLLLQRNVVVVVAVAAVVRAGALLHRFSLLFFFFFVLLTSYASFCTDYSAPRRHHHHHRQRLFIHQYDSGMLLVPRARSEEKEATNKITCCLFSQLSFIDELIFAFFSISFSISIDYFVFWRLLQCNCRLERLDNVSISFLGHWEHSNSSAERDLSFFCGGFSLCPFLLKPTNKQTENGAFGCWRWTRVKQSRLKTTYDSETLL